MNPLRTPAIATTLATAIAILFAASAQAEAPYSFGNTPGKLPKDVIPVEYEATLTPDLASNRFRGTETVEIDVLQTTSKIVLNVANIDISSASLQGKHLPKQNLQASIDEPQQTASFALAQPLPPGRYQLRLEFKGKINRESRGLFALQYKDGEQDKTMLTSTMEPSDARRMLPLWDEPAFRASFRLSVELPAGFSAYSNTPQTADQPLPGGLHRISFAPTPKMASYLIMLTAGELERNSVTQDGVEMGFITTKGKVASTAFAADSAKDILHYFNGYFGVKYPLPKLDHIAVPGSFHGAMENWGGIVYNESIQLWDPKINAAQDKHRIFEVTAHEMAHQWFGNLVTMGWWDNLWLNEAFASWMAAKTVNRFHPEWRMQLEEMVERNQAMGSDARQSTHPIQTRITTEHEAAAAFDEITYTKGSAVLSMLEAWIGEAPFQRGIASYMKKHQYGNTTSADLWQALAEASGKPVDKVASSWIVQAGLPLVKVAQQCEQGQRKVTLSQQRFLSDGSTQDRTLWQIPLQFGVLGGKTESILLDQASTTLTLPGCSGTLVIDPDSIGYYRVQYDEASFKALASQVSQLSDASRLKLVSDTWAQVGTGKLPLASFTNLVSQLRDEPRLAVWAVMAYNLEFLDRIAEHDPQRPLLRQYISRLLGPKLQQLGWDEQAGETDEQRDMRHLMIQVLAQTGDPAIIAEARARFARFIKDPASLSPGSRDFVMEIVGRHADEASYNQLLALTLKAGGSRERHRYGTALANAIDPKLAARSLQITLRGDLSPELASMMVPQIAENEHVQQAWEFATAHREALLKMQDALMVPRFFPSIVASSSQTSDADMLEAYVRQHFGPDALAEAKRTAESIRLRAKRKQQLLPQLSAAFKADKG